MRALLALLAAIPAGAGYVLARSAYLVLYHVVRYRRATVRENLRHAFPDRSAAARAAIEQRFYRHLCNLFVEIIRSTRMSREEFARRVHFTNPGLLRDVTDDHQKQAIILLIHQGNWEWMLHAAKTHLPLPADPVYKPLHSAFWDGVMLASRSRFGATPMTIDSVAREVIRGRRRKRLIVMLADQAGPREGGYWTEFLHRPASFYRGADKLAQALGIPVLFAQCRLVETGQYEVRFHEVSRPPHESDGESILERYVRLAERFIAEQPEAYLWTNRRWKKAPPDAYLRSKASGKTAETQGTP